jgi:hypothetical protein
MHRFINLAEHFNEKEEFSPYSIEKYSIENYFYYRLGLTSSVPIYNFCGTV